MFAILGHSQGDQVSSRSTVLATVSALFAVTALLLWPTTATAAHGPKKVPPGQARKMPTVVVPGPVVTPTVVVVRVLQAPAVVASPLSRPRSVPVAVTQPAPVAQAPVAFQPVAPAPAGGLGAPPVVVRPGRPAALPAPPRGLTGTPGAIDLSLPYEAMGIASGAVGTVL